MLENSSPAGWRNRVLVLLTLGLILATYYAGYGFYLPWAFLILLPWAARYGDLRTVQLILIFLASYTLPKLFLTRQPFLVGKGIGVVVYLYVALLIVPLRQTMDWLRAGRWTLVGTILALAVILLSAGGLIGWFHFAKPDMSGYAKTLPHVSARILPLYMGGFAVINALLEEIVWRGFVMTALDAAFGAGIFSVIVQAVIFGMAHFIRGFPAGWSGAGLAGLFGLAMGLMRRYTGGLMVPWIAHSAADFVVISLIVRFA
jgi:membrane protease YdiL (CAAX protease family)